MLFEFSSVTKVYGTVIGVNDVNLSLAPGAYGLLGPNGAGKSTLLHLITGQLSPSIGRLKVFGRTPWNCRETRRRLGFCPEADVLYPTVTGLEFVRYLMQLHGMSWVEADKRARSALESVGLEEAMHRRIRTYSRGMRQRAKLAQALAHEPEVLILDEPLNGLDPIGRYEMTRRLRGLIEAGKSLLMASHVLHEVQAVTDQFILIYGSRVLASGRTDEIRSLMAEAPHQVRIRCRCPAELGKELLDGEVVEGVQVEGDLLHLSTRRPAAFYQKLPEVVGGLGVTVEELTSPDESLESLFDYLIARI